MPGNSSLFVLPAGEGVRGEPALQSPERWDRLIGGFGEAGGLLVLIARPDAPVISVLGKAGAGLVWVGRARGVPGGITLAATVGAVKRRSRPWWRVGHGPEMALWKAVAWAAIAAAGSGLAAILWIQAMQRPSGTVTLRERVPEPVARAGTNAGTNAGASADTVSMVERLGPVDAATHAQYAIEVMAASTASNANSWLQEHANDAGLFAATIAVVSIRNGSQGASKWHKVMVGAWHDAAAADSAVAVMRRTRIVAGETGVVVSAPYAMLLADSASHERARAVMDVWRAKGLVPYALKQDDGSVRVYAGAFVSVAEAITMAAMVHTAGGTPIVAMRTGRPD